MTGAVASARRPNDYRHDLNWSGALTFLATHLLGIFGVVYAVVAILMLEPLYTLLSFKVSGTVFAPVWYTPVFAWCYYRLAHYSISIGLHRLYSHGMFEAAAVVHYVLLVISAGTLQGSALWWSGKHRCHHAKTDTPEDVHSRALWGFLHAHIGWMLTKTGVAAPSKRYIAHFIREREGVYKPLWWQYRNYHWLAPAMAYGVPVLVCGLWSDPLGGLLLAALRLVLQWHTTWAINSLTHTDTVGVDGSARNVPWLVYWAVGEGYHKYHHDNPKAWRFGAWDPSAFVIAGLIRLGLLWQKPRVLGT